MQFLVIEPVNFRCPSYLTFIKSICRQMNSVETCEPYFAYIRRFIKLDPDTMDLIATNTGEVTLL